MVARVSTVAFQGIEGVPVEVQVMVAPGKVGMQSIASPERLDFTPLQMSGLGPKAEGLM